LENNVPAPEVQSLLTEINNDIHRRVLRLVEAAMRGDGWGEPSARFALIIMGSGGRGENFLAPDQDNDRGTHRQSTDRLNPIAPGPDSRLVSP